MSSIFWSIASFYLFMKIAYFFSLVRTLVKFEPMQKHVRFLGIIYTAGVGFLFYMLMSELEQDFAWSCLAGRASRSVGARAILVLARLRPLGISTFYFWLLTRYDEGVVFWTPHPCSGSPGCLVRLSG